MIPKQYKRFCENPEIKILGCEYYLNKDCPNTCYFSRRISQGISHTAKTGLERFKEKYGKDWREMFI